MSALRGCIARLLLPLLLAAALVACGGRQDELDPPMPDLPAPQLTASRIDPEALSAPRWEAMLVAGDKTLHVADDAVLELDDRFQLAGVPVTRLHLLSADKERYLGVGGGGPDESGGSQGRGDRPSRPGRFRLLEGGTAPARPALVLRTVAALDGRRGAGCFFYLASKPSGSALKLLDGELDPEQLDRALSVRCSDAPTVVVISGCATAPFAAPPMARPNRLILAAAARDKSFGCGANLGLTTFDECFLGALDGAPTWAAIFDRTRACVVRRERLVDQPSDAPQSTIGALVEGLPAPWAKVPDTRGSAGQVRFQQGIGRFTPDAAPYYSTLKARTRPQFEAYAHAPVPKAMALTLAGTVAWVAASHGESSEDVARLALQRCEWESSGACILYARDQNLAAAGPSGFPEIHPPTLPRDGAFRVADVPFVRDDQRQELEQYRSLPEPKALALGPDTEVIGMATGATVEAAERAALARCNTHPNCVPYAQNDRVILGYSE